MQSIYVKMCECENSCRGMYHPKADRNVQTIIIGCILSHMEVSRAPHLHILITGSTHSDGHEIAIAHDARAVYHAVDARDASFVGILPHQIFLAVF